MPETAPSAPARCSGPAEVDAAAPGRVSAATVPRASPKSAILATYPRRSERCVVSKILAGFRSLCCCLCEAGKVFQFFLCA